jgi:hypothetical protein
MCSKPPVRASVGGRIVTPAMIDFEVSFLSETHRVAVDKAGGLGRY